jgi:hypothetical protein
MSALNQRLRKSNEEFLKFGENLDFEEIPQLMKARVSVFTLFESLVEGYKSKQITFHLHFFASSSGSGTNRDFCAMITGSDSLLNAMPAFSADEFGLGFVNCEHGEQDSPMFIDVAEEVYDVKGIVLRPLSAVVGLQSLDFCRRFWGNSFKPVPPKLVFEDFGCVRNGKHILVTGLVVRSANEFPHQIIESRSKILKNIPDNQRNRSGDRSMSIKSENQASGIFLNLGDHFARIRCEIPVSFPFERLEVLCGPEDFLPNRI